MTKPVTINKTIAEMTPAQAKVLSRRQKAIAKSWNWTRTSAVRMDGESYFPVIGIEVNKATMLELDRVEAAYKLGKPLQPIDYAIERKNKKLWGQTAILGLTAPATALAFGGGGGLALTSAFKGLAEDEPRDEKIDDTLGITVGMGLVLGAVYAFGKIKKLTQQWHESKDSLELLRNAKEIEKSVNLEAVEKRREQLKHSL